MSSAPRAASTAPAKFLSTGGEKYDVIFDAVGRHSFRRCRRALRPGGMFITTHGGFVWHVPVLMVLTR